MNNSTNKNPSFRPGQREVDEITRRARKGGRDGAVLGGVGGYVAGAVAPRGLRKARLAGAGVGAGVGYIAGKAIGRKVAAKDDIASRKALREMAVLSAIDEKLTHLETRAKYLGFETIDGATAMKPRSRSGQHPVRIFPKSKRKDTQQVGIDDEGDYQLTEERQRLADEFGWAIINALPDEMLTREHAQALLEEVQSRMAKANGPRASTQNDPEFARRFFESKLGTKLVSTWTNAELNCHFLHAVNRGDLVEFGISPKTTNLAILNRERNSEGQFIDNESVSPDAIQRAYHPDPARRKTGEPVGAGIAAGAALLGVRAGLKAKARALGKRLRLKGGSASPPTYEAETQALSRRLPLMTTFVRGPGSYRIARATLRGGKKQPGVPKLKGGKRVPKPARHNMALLQRHLTPTELAFLIHDGDFPIVPMKQPKLPKGMRQRVKPALTRREVIERLKKITALSSHEFTAGVGKVAAEAIIDGGSLAGLAGETPAQRRARQARIAQQQNTADDSDISNDSTAQPRTLDSALDRLASMDFSAVGRIGSIAGKYLPEAAVIGSADLVAERANAAIEARKKRQKRLVRQSGGVQATPSMGGAPTTMSAIVGTLNEFSDDSRNRARKRAGELGAAGVGGTAGAIAGLKHDPGVPIRTGDLQPGMRVTKRFGPGGLFQHVGVVDESGRVVHRTSGSSKLRSVAPSTFQKTGKGPLRHEVHADDLPPRQAAANASRATGTRAGRYSACQGNNCQDAAERLISRGKPVSRQLRKAIGGAAIGAAGLGSVAHILGNRRKDK